MKKYMIILSIGLAMMACKEEEEPIASTPTPAEIISRTWKVQSVVINGQVDNTTNYSHYLFTFNANQTYRFMMPDTQEGSWELISNASALVLDKGTDAEQRVEVQKLSEAVLELEFTEPSDKTGTRQMLYALVP